MHACGLVCAGGQHVHPLSLDPTNSNATPHSLFDKHEASGGARVSKMLIPDSTSPFYTLLTTRRAQRRPHVVTASNQTRHTLYNTLYHARLHMCKDHGWRCLAKQRIHSTAIASNRSSGSSLGLHTASTSNNSGANTGGGGCLPRLGVGRHRPGTIRVCAPLGATQPGHALLQHDSLLVRLNAGATTLPRHSFAFQERPVPWSLGELQAPL